MPSCESSGLAYTLMQEVFEGMTQAQMANSTAPSNIQNDQLQNLTGSMHP